MWEDEEGHTVKTEKEGQHIRHIAQTSRRTAAWLCTHVRAQQALVQHELLTLAKRQRCLQESLDQLRKSLGACRSAQTRQQDRAVTALINLLQRMPGHSRS